MSGTRAGSVASPFRQPKAVFAVAFACVVSFMGIGLEKPVASAAYSFVRFISGGLAPYAAGRMVLAVDIHFPFYIATGAILLGIGILAAAHRLLNQAERIQAEQVPVVNADAPRAGLGVVEDQAEGVPVS